jgi:type II secretory pathway component GspD/PulD (secretin)
MITYDVPSNSILVANASPSQLQEIEQLIAEFDQPAPTDSVELRNTAAIKIHYSRPSIIAAAVKEVYRDLLSSRDKEFDRGDQRQERDINERVTVINYGGSSSGSDNDRPSPVNIGFDGALSLGADDVSGILIVSAQKGIFDDIVKMVRELDAEAAPQTTVHVHRVNGNVTAAALQKAINEAVGKPWLGGRPEQTGTTPDQDRSRSDRDRDRDRGDRRRDRDND